MEKNFGPGLPGPSGFYSGTPLCRRGVPVRMVADRILGELEKAVPFEGKQVALKSVIQAQTRHLACSFRGERTYRCYRFRW